MRVTRDNIDKLYDQNISVETRTITLWGEVNEEMSETAIKGLLLLTSINSNPLTILLNSDGGDWTEGMAIFDYIRSFDQVQVTIRALGKCESMATVIMQAADVRLLSENCTFMVHHGSNESKSDQISYERWAEHSKQNRKKMCDIYASRSGKSSAYWNRKCAHDYILTAQQALAEGLIDGIL